MAVAQQRDAEIAPNHVLRYPAWLSRTSEKDREHHFLVTTNAVARLHSHSKSCQSDDALPKLQRTVRHFSPIDLFLNEDSQRPMTQHGVTKRNLGAHLLDVCQPKG